MGVIHPRNIKQNLNVFLNHFLLANEIFSSEAPNKKASQPSFTILSVSQALTSVQLIWLSSLKRDGKRTHVNRHKTIISLWLLAPGKASNQSKTPHSLNSMQQKQYTVMGAICWLFQKPWPRITVSSVFPPVSKGLSLYRTHLSWYLLWVDFLHMLRHSQLHIQKWTELWPFCLKTSTCILNWVEYLER